MAGVLLTHRECVGLLQPEGSPRCGLVAIDGRVPVPLACFPLAGGDVFIPAEEDGVLARMAAWRPVSIEFTGRDQAGSGRWTVRGLGLARPIHDPAGPWRLPRAARLAVSGRCGGGVRVVLARLHGYQEDPAVDLPMQRAGRPEARTETEGRT
ncbi:hypothetical protein [Amycolatopsis panacis]|uniref:Pyridoxamine 5'-phosphate oxidase family protein n=1 Tax=Amycolatopsis panacis TaxID=2340917 RepID=A0A419I6U1_9PSEU|nr:hypothetical protein [Amycolatopsis panacis]RJQ87260.1 hypothetical protein D5S19_10035 [Amycolatopsis panacis]